MKKSIVQVIFISAIIAFSASTAFASNEPIPGVDIVVKKNPGGTKDIAIPPNRTDATGQFSFNLEEGNYLLNLNFDALAKSLSIKDKEYAAQPDNYEISLVIAGIVGENGSIFDRWGVETNGNIFDRWGIETNCNIFDRWGIETNGNYEDKPLINSEKTNAISIKIPKGGGKLTGTINYTKKESNDKPTNKSVSILQPPPVDTYPGAAISTSRSNIKHPNHGDYGKTMIYVGAGYNFLNKTTKSDAFLNNAIGINLSIYQPLLERKTLTLGIQMAGEYAISTKDNLPELPSVFHVIGETSSTVAFKNSEGMKQSAFKIEAGPQLNFHIGDHFVISPAFLVGALLLKQKEFSAEQTTILGDETHKYTLLKKWDVTTGGVVLTPKLRLNYLINDCVGLWAEANYAFLPEIKSFTSTFNPQDTPDDEGNYDIFQLDNGKTTIEQTTTKYSAVGVNAGLVFSFGKKKEKSPCDPYLQPTTNSLNEDNANPTDTIPKLSYTMTCKCKDKVGTWTATCYSAKDCDECCSYKKKGRLLFVAPDGNKYAYEGKKGRLMPGKPVDEPNKNENMDIK